MSKHSPDHNSSRRHRAAVDIRRSFNNCLRFLLFASSSFFGIVLLLILQRDAGNSFSRGGDWCCPRCSRYWNHVNYLGLRNRKAHDNRLLHDSGTTDHRFRDVTALQPRPNYRQQEADTHTRLVQRLRSAMSTIPDYMRSRPILTSPPLRRNFHVPINYVEISAY